MDGTAYTRIGNPTPKSQLCITDIQLAARRNGFPVHYNIWQAAVDLRRWYSGGITSVDRSIAEVLMIELLKDFLGMNNTYPENDEKEITLSWCTACGWLDAMAYRFYQMRGYKINRKEVRSHAEPAVQS